jgi:hypothetical protein
MYVLMTLQIALLAEWLITHIAVKWPVTTMYEVMFLQITMLIE